MTDIEGQRFSVNDNLLPEIFKFTSDIILVTDGRYVIELANRVLLKSSGYKIQDLLGKKLRLLFRKEKRASYLSKISRALKDHRKWEGQLELLRKDGAPIRVSAVFSAVTTSKEMLNKIVMVGRDLGHEKKLDGESTHSADSAHRAVDSMWDALYVTDVSGKILMCNDGFKRMLGYSDGEVIGAGNPYPWLRSRDGVKLNQVLRILHKEDHLNNFVMEWRRRNNTIIPVSLSASRLNPGADNSPGYVFTLRDVSDVQYVEELLRTNERYGMLMSEVKRKTAILRSLDEIHRLLLQDAKIDRIFSSIVEEVKKLVDHDLAGFYLYNENQKALVAHILSKQTPFSRKLANSPLLLGEGLIGRAAVLGKTEMVNDAQMDPRSVYPEGMRPKLEHFIAVPMKEHERLYGVLLVARYRDPKFLEEEAELVELFGHAVTVALENAWLWNLSPSRDGKRLTDPFTDCGHVTVPDRYEK